MPNVPKFTSLAVMREEALAGARRATDPIDAQQYRDLALHYTAAMAELEATGFTIVPQPDPKAYPWRSVPLAWPRGH